MATIDWLTNLNNQTLLTPRSHLVEALEFIGGNGDGQVAVDCGCGSGRDTVYLLEKGYRVFAFDNDIPRLETLSEHPLTGANPNLDIQISSFAEYRFPKAHLINASACLFFSTQADFDILWRNICKSLHKDGIFCGHFLGSDTLEENEKLPILTHSTKELERLLSDFYIISWKKKQEYSANLTGKRRLWLVHTIIAMKK
ncbi:class I SAM-dependent methyltransferase [Photobacterium sp. GSS17]|uniref:class I SAM-dependent methyltransferase n=1 Tax=Photobacterium TaxID=657 RepID=UPI00236070EF|nr:class I SAM-dependent methyltransferase [Photobacterium sp. GSS17]